MGIRPVLSAGLLAAIVSLSACSSSSHSSTGSTTTTTGASGSPTTTATGDVAVEKNLGITVTGGFNSKPTVKFPDRLAPSQLVEQTLITGHGTKVVAGDTVIVNYVGEIWPTKEGAAAQVFDSSFSRGQPAGFVLGTGAVIPGFDKTLVGKAMGSRMLLSIPPADGYGSTGNSQAGISGTDTLVFVVDLLTDYKPNATAPGVTAAPLPATGWPKITNIPAQEPKITSVAGVKAPTSPASKLLVTGNGAKIDTSKQLVLQIVETDIATGKQTHSTWGQAPQLANAQNVLQLVTALSGQSIGARAVALVPAVPAQPASATAAAQAATPAEVLIVDVVGQF